MSKLWKWFIPGHIACLPFTIGYALWCFFLYGARSWGVRNGVLISIGDMKADGKTSRIVGNPGAQTVGASTCFATVFEEQRDDLHVHENTHIVEAFICSIVGYAAAGAFVAFGASPLWLLVGGVAGVLGYSLAYIAIFLRWYFTDQGEDEKPGWQDDYHRNNFEKWAYAAQARYVSADAAAKAKAWK